jgi:hypothetical protein
MSQALNDWSLFLIFLTVAVGIVVLIRGLWIEARNAPKDPISPYHHYLKSRGLQIGAGKEYRRVLE